ncbi:MAG: hypothetical protein JNK67_26850 [Alphaproteobacteria bacterium]|nr:hypothetical protein [Alphaproteobacteria bacterium]
MTMIRATTRRLLLGGLGAVAAFTAMRPASPARAQAGRPGRVSTRSFARLAPGLTIAVTGFDDAPETQRVRAAIVRTLEGAGHRVVTGEAPWRLSFTTEVRMPAPDETSRRGSPPPGSDAAQPSEMGHDQLPDRPFRPRQAAPRGTATGRLRHVVNMSLAESRNSRVRWQGHVRYDAVEPDPAAMLVRLVPILLADFGKSVAERRFSLD